MADFDPDAYLTAKPSVPSLNPVVVNSDNSADSSFDPDAYLGTKGALPPEAADHGLSERQKLPPIGKALSPVTEYWPTYQRMKGEAEDQVSEGLHQIVHPDDMSTVHNFLQGHGLSDVLTGAAKTAIGAAGFAASPISAAYRSIIGQPIEDTTGIPREWTETAAQLATPGIGLTSLKSAPKVPATIPKPPPDPFGVTLTEGESTGNLEAIRREQAAKRDTLGPAATKQATDFGAQREQQLSDAQADVTRQLDPAGNQILADNPQQAAQLTQDAVQQQAARAKTNVTQAYDRAKALPGEIHPDAFTDMPVNIREELNNRPEPVIIDEGTPVAARMLKYLDDRISKLKIRNDAELSSPVPSAISGVSLEGVDQWRKGLSTMRGDALRNFTNPSDARAANAVMHAFDERVGQAVNSPMFHGDPQAVDAWNSARSAASERFKTYGNDTVGKKIQSIVGDARIDKDPASLQAVTNYIYGATGTAPTDLNIAVAKRLQKILGQDSPEWAAIKQGYFQRLTENTAGMKDKGYGTVANNLAQALDGKGSGLSEVLYSPAERDMLRAYGDLHRKMEVPATGANWSETSTFLSKAMGAIKDRISGLIGAVVAHVVVPGSHGVGEYAGSQISSKLTGMRENAANARAIEKQMPLVGQRLQQWQQAVNQQQRINNVASQGRLALASTNVADALGRLGFDHGSTMKLLQGAQGPGTSQAQEPKEHARGGKVQPVPESNETLVEQQKQLLDGSRNAQLFPKGKGELKLPKGMYRAKMPNGDVFHYAPKRMNVKKLLQASKSSKENEVLGLGPITKHEAVKRASKGEHPVAIVERTPKGIETRAAAGTHATMAAQLHTMAKNKSAANSLSVEHPWHTLAKRRLKGYADGGTPTTDDDTDLPTATTSNTGDLKHIYMNMNQEGNSQEKPDDFNQLISQAQERLAKPPAKTDNKEIDQKLLPELPDNRLGAVKDLADEEFSKGTKVGNKLTGSGGEERFQTWPERMIRSGASLAHDVMTGDQPLLQPGLRREDFTDKPAPSEPTEDSTWLGKKLGIAPVAAQPNDEAYERVQDMAGMAGGSGLMTGATDATLGSAPFLRPALKYGDKIYKAPVNGTHLDAIPEDIYPTFQKQAMNGDDISNFNFGFMNHKGQFLDREKALDYAVQQGLVDPHAANQGALTSTILSDSSATGAPLAALEHAQPFYSAVEKTIDTAPQQKMHGVQWANWLKNQPGVKPDELQYTGIDNWLREQKGPITKQQVQDYIGNNKVQVNDVVKGGKPELTEDGFLEQARWEVEDNHPGIDTQSERYQDEVDYRMQQLRDEGVPQGTKYHNWQLPGGKNYQEHLLTLPEKIDPVTARAKELAEQENGKGSWDRIGGGGQEHYLRDARMERRKTEKESGNLVTVPQNYKSSHWDEPNVVAHVRTNERDVGGVPAMHIEEIQSDFAQSHRKTAKQVSDYVGKHFDEIAAKMVDDGIIKKECD